MKTQIKIATESPFSDVRPQVRREYKIVTNGNQHHVEARRITPRWYDSFIGSPAWVMVTYPTTDSDKVDKDYKLLCLAEDSV